MTATLVLSKKIQHSSTAEKYYLVAGNDTLGEVYWVKKSCFVLITGAAFLPVCGGRRSHPLRHCHKSFFGLQTFPFLLRPPFARGFLEAFLGPLAPSYVHTYTRQNQSAESLGT